MKEHAEGHDRILNRRVVPGNGVFTWHCKQFTEMGVKTGLGEGYEQSFMEKKKSLKKQG